MLAVLALVPLALVAVGSVAGAVSPTDTLGPGTAEVVTAPLHPTVPSDGRLRGTGFAATVTGVAWPASVTAHGVTTVASSGDRLVVFTLRLTEPTGDMSPLATGSGATASVSASGRTVPVDLALLDQQIAGATGTTGSATETYSLSIPDHDHRVVLSLTRNGFAQHLDLWTLRRLPPSPAVLYREPTGASVAASRLTSTTLTATNPADGFSSTATLKVRSVTLTYFAPDGSGTPGTPTKAFLVVDLAATVMQQTANSPTWGHFLSGFSPIPGDRLTFTPSGGAPVTGSSAPQESSVGNPATDDGLFDADYWFAVPASLTAGTIAVTPGPVTGVEFTGFVGTGTVALDLPSVATLDVSFPEPPAASATQPTPPWVGAPLPPTGAAAAGSGVPGSARGGFPVWLAVVIVALLALAAVLGERVVRHRRPAPASEARVAGKSPDVGEEEPLHQGGPAVAAPIPTPTGPTALGDPGQLVVRVLGSVEVAGWEPPPERRGTLEELCAYLALHAERPHGTADLLGALWPVDGERGEATPKTLHNHLSRLRQAVGAEHLPDAVTSGGYHLVGSVTDWSRFEGLVAEADNATGDEADALRTEALGLVRGVPFAGVAGDQYGWAYSSGLASAMTVAVARCARRLSDDRLTAGDPNGAEQAARAGLRRAPHDEELWALARRAAGASGDPSGVIRVDRDMTAALGADDAAAVRRRVQDQP